jgi:predicted SAM-dependent methyltransferase
MRYHLGCGDKHVDGYVNVDIRDTPATDEVMDLTLPEFPSGRPVDAVFSHAFFEHLRRDARVPHLKTLLRAVDADGFVCYIGLPDFRRVAELYLGSGPGIIGPHFDLFNVYRYTHGDPEMTPEDGWIGQLHKSLFDVPEVGRLLRDAGFASYVVFRYGFPGDPPGLDLSLGLYARPQKVPEAALREAARGFLADFDRRFLDLETVQFEDALSRPAPLARAAALPPRRLYQRAAYGIASILARNTHPA